MGAMRQVVLFFRFACGQEGLQHLYQAANHANFEGAPLPGSKRSSPGPAKPAQGRTAHGTAAVDEGGLAVKPDQAQLARKRPTPHKATANPASSPHRK